jgi:BirA family biotin operon repressor/biotin-[acetyl-CoA-carboxylase] ligase
MMPASSPAPPDVAAAFNGAIARNGPLRLDLRWYATVSSTMDVAEDAAHGGAPEGVVIAADEQTHGRGRRGRAWSSPPGAGLYVTFLLRPPVATTSRSVLSLLTLASGVAVRTAIAQSTGFLAELKWPNDLMVGRRKLAGILAEGIDVGLSTQSVLVGVGINVLAAAHPGDVARRATSLETELGRPIDRALLLEELLMAVPRAYDELRRGETSDMLRQWREASPSAVGRTVWWEDPAGRHHGVTAGVDDTGGLLVKTDRGTERLLAGELTWT